MQNCVNHILPFYRIWVGKYYFNSEAKWSHIRIAWLDRYYIIPGTFVDHLLVALRVLSYRNQIWVEERSTVVLSSQLPSSPSSHVLSSPGSEMTSWNLALFSVWRSKKRCMDYMINVRESEKDGRKVVCWAEISNSDSGTERELGIGKMLQVWEREPNFTSSAMIIDSEKSTIVFCASHDHLQFD